MAELTMQLVGAFPSTGVAHRWYVRKTSTTDLQIRIADSGGNLIPLDYVLPTRSINTGNHLTGGGDLSANRTLSLQFTHSTYVNDSESNPRLYFGGTGNQYASILRASDTGQNHELRSGANVATWKVAADSGNLLIGNVPWARLSDHVSVNSGTGLTGGGSLSANRTIALTGQALSFHNLGSNGLVCRNGGTIVARSIQGTTDQIVVTNGNGASGNPTIALASSFLGNNGILAKYIKTDNWQVISGTTSVSRITSQSFSWTPSYYGIGRKYIQVTKGAVSASSTGDYDLTFNWYIKNEFISIFSETITSLSTSGVNYEIIAEIVVRSSGQVLLTFTLVYSYPDGTTKRRYTAYYNSEAYNDSFLIDVRVTPSSTALSISEQSTQITII